MSQSPLPATVSYGALLAELKTRINQAQYAALRAVNKELTALYWDIGQLINERQEAEGWGKSVVENISADLRREFGEKSGFSVQNLWYMRKFYREYREHPNLQPLAGEISWTKNTVILDRCAEALQREFYLRATARFGWTRRVLEHQSQLATNSSQLKMHSADGKRYLPDLANTEKQPAGFEQSRQIVIPAQAGIQCLGAPRFPPARSAASTPRVRERRNRINQRLPSR